MLEAPVQWLIQLIALLPVLLRPGVFLAVIIVLTWFLIVRRGLPGLWRRICRALAVALDAVVGVVLFPEYLLTAARRNRGLSPGALTRAVGTVAEHGLDAAAALYRHNLPGESKESETDSKLLGQSSTEVPGATRRDAPRKPFPWLWCGLVIVVCGGLWVVMDELPRGEAAKRTFAEGFEYWRDIEAWANVDASRRAAPGDQLAPEIASVSYHPSYAHIALKCSTAVACAGRISVRSTTGVVRGSGIVELEAESGEVITVALRPQGGRSRLHVDVSVP